jgi:hypothetical protein
VPSIFLKVNSSNLFTANVTFSVVQCDLMVHLGAPINYSVTVDLFSSFLYNPLHATDTASLSHLTGRVMNWSNAYSSQLGLIYLSV